MPAQRAIFTTGRGRWVDQHRNVIGFQPLRRHHHQRRQWMRRDQRMHHLDPVFAKRFNLVHGLARFNAELS